MFYLPLTTEQKRHLSPTGERVWTADEIEIMRRNLRAYDRVRTILTRRCKVPDCGYVISSLEESFAVPKIGEVCGVCYHMFQALQSPGLRLKWYFFNLHEEWEKDQTKRRDRMGL